MIIEAAAGFIIGGSLLFPKTLSRFNSLKIGLRDAFKIFVSTIPFTIIAAFLEGYVTRYANTMPSIIKIVISLHTRHPSFPSTVKKESNLIPLS